MRNELRVGNKAELLLLLRMEKCGFICEKSQGKNSFWDLRVEFGLDDIFFEIKYDVMSDRTGNLAVEYFNPKSMKPSGVTITQSDFWVYCLGAASELWISSVEDLRNFIKEEKPHRLVDVAGDSNASLMLYRKEHLLQGVFRRLDSISDQEIKDLLRFYVEQRNDVYHAAAGKLSPK